MDPSPGCRPTPVPSSPISSAPLTWAEARPLGLLHAAPAASSASQRGPYRGHWVGGCTHAYTDLGSPSGRGTIPVGSLHLWPWAPHLWDPSPTGSFTCGVGTWGWELGCPRGLEGSGASVSCWLVSQSRGRRMARDSARGRPQCPTTLSSLSHGPPPQGSATQV